MPYASNTQTTLQPDERSPFIDKKILSNYRKYFNHTTWGNKFTPKKKWRKK